MIQFFVLIYQIRQMSSTTQTTCIGCTKPFATDNLPRNAKCAHTYCEKCLKTLTQCIIDHHPIDNTIPVSSYPINMSVAKSITRSHNLNPSTSFSNSTSSYRSVNTSNNPIKPSNLQKDYPEPESLNYQSVQPSFVPTFSHHAHQSSHYQIPPSINQEAYKVPQIQPIYNQNVINPQKQVCNLHNKEMDLICLDDGIIICSNCALFGDHKLHNIKTVDSCHTQCKAAVQKTTVLLSKLIQIQSVTNSKSIEEKIQIVYREKKNKLSVQIKSYYQKLLGKVLAAEKQSYILLEKIMNQQKNTTINQLINQDKEVKKSKWMQEANNFIIQSRSMGVNKKDLQKTCKFLDKGTSQDNFLKQGEYLIVEFNSLAKLTQQKINKSFEDICINMQNSQLQTILEKGCKIQKSNEQQIQAKWISAQKGDDDFLLEDLASSKSTQRVHTFSVDTHNQFYQQSIDLNFQSRINTQSHQNSNFKQSKQKFQKQPFSTFNGQARKKKKVKVPEKYQQAVEDLRHDRSQCIDFTNAQLGDAGVLPIFELLRGTSRIKTLKLIRNKLTDECLLRLLQCCLDCKITTINLSQNSLSDYALQILQNGEYRQLRSITLNQNRINQRNAKPKIQELKKIGLNILV